MSGLMPSESTGMFTPCGVYFGDLDHSQDADKFLGTAIEILSRALQIAAKILTELEEERRRQEMKEDGRRLQKILEEVLTEMEEERRRLQKAVEESSRQRKMEEERRRRQEAVEEFFRHAEKMEEERRRAIEMEEERRKRQEIEEERRRQEMLRFMKDLRWRALAAKGRGQNSREKIMRDLVNRLKCRLEERKETHEERGSRKLNDMSGGDNRDQTDLPNNLEANRQRDWTADGDWSTGAEEHAQQGKAMETKSREAHAKDSAKLYGLKETLPMFQPDFTKNQDKKADLDKQFVEKRNLILAVSGSISRSSEDLHMGRVDIHAGDENLLNADFRQKHGISDIIISTKISVPEEVFNDPEPRLFVRMRPVGEGKDSWEHCTTPEGEAALSEEQPLYISELLEGCSSFPASATWVLETPKKCTPSSILEAVLEINIVTSGSMVQAVESNNITGGNPLALLSIQVQVKGKEHKAVTDVQLERTCVAPGTEQYVSSAEEKYQTEPMEK